MSIALVIGGDDDVATQMTAVLGHQTVALPAESVDDSGSFLRGLDPATLPEAIVFADTVPVPRSMALAGEIRRLRPDIDMVLIAPIEASLVLEAMRAGFRDVAASIDDAGLLANLRTRLDSRSGNTLVAPPPVYAPPPDFHSHTIAVVSPKGGVGKSSTSANLTVALAQIAPMEVVLVDLDLQFGDLSTVLDLTPTHTLEDAFSAPVRDNLLLKTFLTVHPAGFYVLCGADSPAANEKVDGEQIARLIKQLQDQFRYVVLDTAAGIDEAALTAVENSDDLVMVTTMDMACLRSVRKEYELLGELEILPPSRHVVLNFADKQSGLRVKDVESVLGLPVDVVLPRTRDVPVASNRGVPVVLSAKNSGFSKGIRKLAKRIDDRARAAQPSPAHKRVEVT